MFNENNRKMTKFDLKGKRKCSPSLHWLMGTACCYGRRPIWKTSSAGYRPLCSNSDASSKFLVTSGGRLQWTNHVVPLCWLGACLFLQQQAVCKANYGVIALKLKDQFFNRLSRVKSEQDRIDDWKSKVVNGKHVNYVSLVAVPRCSFAEQMVRWWGPLCWNLYSLPRTIWWPPVIIERLLRKTGRRERG